MQTGNPDLKVDDYKDFLNLWKKGNRMVETYGHNKRAILKNNKI
jgi:hypothetical protein